MDNSISFSKIVATPTLNSWAQAYNAGKLFAVLSLEKSQSVSSDIESLNMLGKNLLEKLEQEFFTLEAKNLESIKKAISSTFENTPEGIHISFASGVFINNILYLFTLGKGKIFIKRNGSFGLVLDSSDNIKEISSSSGFVKDNDLIVLGTKDFSEVVGNSDLDSALNASSPSEMSESLAPKVHKAENGKVSAIIIKYTNPKGEAEEIIQGSNETDDTKASEEKIEQTEDIEEKKPLFNFRSYLLLIKSKLKKPNIRPKKSIFLIIAVIIVIILSLTIFLNIQNQNNEKLQALFSQVYSKAEKEYDEGQSLADLNKTLALESFASSQKIIEESVDQFLKKSQERIKLEELLEKVKKGLATASPLDESGLDRSKLSVSVLNGSGKEGVAGKAANILKGHGYNVTSTGNADNYNYEGITIKVKKEKSDFLNLLKKDLAKDYSVKASSSDLSSDSATDAVIIIGK